MFPSSQAMIPIPEMAALETMGPTPVNTMFTDEMFDDYLEVGGSVTGLLHKFINANHRIWISLHQ